MTGSVRAAPADQMPSPSRPTSYWTALGLVATLVVIAVRE
jgi:hypothetical protein